MTLESVSMKEVSCVVCDEELHVPEDSDVEVSGETPLEHYNRTGHLWLDPPVVVACTHCEYIWFYGGEQNHPNCPNCGGYTTVGEFFEE